MRKRLDKASEPDDKAKIEEEFHIADVDYHYTRYFPFLEHYVSLYAAAKPEGDASDGPIAKRSLHSERPPMWKEIEAAMEKGQGALERIQERRADKASSTAPLEGAAGEKSTVGDAKAKKAKKESRSGPDMHADRRKILYPREEAEQVDDDSDGSGFFD